MSSELYPLAPWATVRTEEHNRNLSAHGGWIAGVGPQGSWSLTVPGPQQPHVILSARSTLSFFWEQKEVLLHILQYIHYLQSSINVTKALLQLHANHGHGELGGK